MYRKQPVKSRQMTVTQWIQNLLATHPLHLTQCLGHHWSNHLHSSCNRESATCWQSNKLLHYSKKTFFGSECVNTINVVAPLCNSATSLTMRQMHKSLLPKDAGKFWTTSEANKLRYFFQLVQLLHKPQSLQNSPLRPKIISPVSIAHGSRGQSVKVGFWGSSREPSHQKEVWAL